MTRHLLGLDTASAFLIPDRRQIATRLSELSALSEVLAKNAALEESYRYQVALGLPVKAETTTCWAITTEAHISLGVFWRYLIRTRVSPLLRCYGQKGYLPHMLEVGILSAPPRLVRDKGTVGKQGWKVSRVKPRGNGTVCYHPKAKSELLPKGQQHDR